MQLVEPGNLGAPILRALNAVPGEGPPGASLHDVAPWFSAERARYGGAGSASGTTWLQADIRGPYPVAVRPPPLSDPDAPAWRQAWQAFRYPRYFHGLASDLGLDPDDYGVRVYVVYGSDDGDLAAHSRASEKGRVAISWIGLDEGNPAYAVLTVAHEIGHALGALDSYDPGTYLARLPEGYVEPFAEPLYPQRYAELMAVDVPLSLRTEREVRGLDEVRIGHRTAARLGWIPKEQADLFYTPPQLGPLDRLPAREAAPAHSAETPPAETQPADTQPAETQPAETPGDAAP